jgi:branched-chain amino acid transport system ATP-binding protein
MEQLNNLQNSHFQENVLETRGLGIDFGGLTALNALDFCLKENQICGLIGPNGAGKTTLFNLLTNIYKPTRGSITLLGEETEGLISHQLNRRGVGRTFQNIRLFHQLTVLENILVAMRPSQNKSMTKSQMQKENLEEAYELLRFFQLDSQAEQISGNLSYGAQRKLEIARALAGHPKVLLLDEPAAGMNPVETKLLSHQIFQIRDRFQVSILLIEHDMKLVMEICEVIWVLNFGQFIACGTPKEISENEQVIEAYLGRREQQVC